MQKQVKYLNDQVQRNQKKKYEEDKLIETSDAIWEAATACDEVELELCTVNPDTLELTPVDWAYLVHGNAPDETISDCLHGKWIDNWCTVTDFGSRPYVVELEQC